MSCGCTVRRLGETPERALDRLPSDWSQYIPRLPSRHILSLKRLQSMMNVFEVEVMAMLTQIVPDEMSVDDIENFRERLRQLTLSHGYQDVNVTVNAIRMVYGILIQAFIDVGYPTEFGYGIGVASVNVGGTERINLYRRTRRKRLQ